MAFFDNFSKKVQDVAFVATEKAQQVAAVAGEKANAVADKAKTEYEMASERRSMDKNYDDMSVTRPKRSPISSRPSRPLRRSSPLTRPPKLRLPLPRRRMSPSSR